MASLRQPTAARRVVGAFALKSSRGSPPEQLCAGGEVPAPTVATMDVEGAAPDGLDGTVGTIRHPACRPVVVEPHDSSDEIERRLLGEDSASTRCGWSGIGAENRPR